MSFFSLPIRVKVLLTVLALIMIVMGLNTSTMANLFRQDKTTYIRDLTAVMVVNLAEETDTLLRSYVANMRMFGDVIYDENIDPVTKQDVMQTLFGNFQDIVAIASQRGNADPVTVFDTSALTRLDVSRAQLLEYQERNPITGIGTDKLDVQGEFVKDGVDLIRLTIEVPATTNRDAYLLAASIDPHRLEKLSERSQGFQAKILNAAGQSVFDPDMKVDEQAAAWVAQMQSGPTAAIGTTREFIEDGVSMIGAVASVADGALLATVQIPTSVVYLTARQLLRNLMIGAVLLFALAAIASLVFARRLTRPLEQLTAAAQKVGKGEFNVSVESTSGDEIGTLSDSFNHMTDELREREAKLESANAALIQSEKLAAFGQLGAGIAHEVKNPLAGILGYTQLALRKLDEDSPVRKNLDIIEKETRRCTDIISNLLKFARQETSNKDATEINEVVDAALTIVDHQMGVNQVEVSRELADDLPTIDGNANQLQQVIMNFAINAQQAMGKSGGRLHVQTCRGDDGGVVLVVADNGPGIPPEIRRKIFEPFFTTKPAGEGTGLGLSVTYGIIQDHGGDIRIEDAEGGGTRFVVTLPQGVLPAS